MNKILSLPPFVEEIEYVEQTPSNGKHKYRFVTKNTIHIKFIKNFIPYNEELTFFDNKGQVWLKIKKNELIISKDYAWDGCTPKKWWGGWWGTPDFKQTHLASLVHDVLLQFHQTEHFPLSRHDIDHIFKDILKHNRFILRGLYYIGVRIGSAIPSKKNNNVKSELTTIAID